MIYATLMRLKIRSGPSNKQLNTSVTMVRRQRQCGSTVRKEHVIVAVSLLLTTSSAFTANRPMLSWTRWSKEREPVRRPPTTRTLQSSRNLDSHEGTLPLLMEQAVLLYSDLSVSGGRISDSQIEQDIRELRQREITRLVEDIGLAMDELKRDHDDETNPSPENTSLGNQNQFYDLQEVSRSFDQAVMNAVATDNINSDDIVYLATEHYRLQQATDTSRDETNQFRVRLEQLKVLIAPTSPVASIARKALKDVQSHKDNNEEKNTLEQTKTPGKPVEKEQQTGTPYFATTVAPVTSDIPDERDTKKVAPEPESVFKSKDSGSGENSLAHEEWNGMPQFKSNPERSESIERPEPGDAVAAVISVGAVAAALVTKAPIFAAGAVLGPVVSSAVSSLQTMKYPFAKGSATDKDKSSDMP